MEFGIPSSPFIAMSNHPIRSESVALSVSVSELVAALAPIDSLYDESATLLAEHVQEIRYHTKLQPGTPVHTTRESAGYASALLETGVDWRIKRAKDILHTLIRLQDTNANSRTYGIWSWFKEEPLEAMSPPDWNWADFIGTQLAQILWRNDAHLDDALRSDLKRALSHAARSIIRRDVTMRYTNIAIMGTYVTLMAGKISQDAALLEYGRERLCRFHAFTEEWGGFPEYNSPTYTIVAIAELTRMLRDFTDEDGHLLVRSLHHRAWREIAIHWHAFSGQWSGPHSRSYQTLLSPQARAFIHRGVRHRIALHEDFPAAVSDILLPLRCPDDLLPFFTGEMTGGNFRQRIMDGNPALDGTTHLAGHFALSSVERGTFWNQSRAITAYSRNKDGPTAFHVRFLRDGYDYSSANLIADQNGASILGAVCFAYDGGNVHCNLDRIEKARIEASDWRLRLQFYGSVKLSETPAIFSAGQTLNFELAAGVVLSVHIPWLVFGQSTPCWEITTNDTGCAVDLVLYKGSAKSFVFDDAFPCALALALTINKAAELPMVRTVIQKDRRLHLEWPQPSGEVMRTAAPLLAASEEEITAIAREVKSRQQK